jgi:hypothetical protein
MEHELTVMCSTIGGRGRRCRRRVVLPPRNVGCDTCSTSHAITTIDVLSSLWSGTGNVGQGKNAVGDEMQEDERRHSVHLASAGPRAHAHPEPVAYLHFPSTGFVVALPDEPGMLVDATSAPVRLALRETDAAGLGLTSDDMALGVAYCSGAGGPGWECVPVELVLSDDGDVRTPRSPRLVLRSDHPAGAIATMLTAG